MNIIATTIAAAFVLGAGTALAQGNADLLRDSDALVPQDTPALQETYRAASAAFAQGDYVAAFRDYDYAAWHGSLAAASRLCVLDAYGIGTAPNPLKAAFWCDRVAAAGHELAGMRGYLREYRLVGQ